MKFPHLKAVLCYAVTLPSSLNEMAEALEKRAFEPITEVQFDTFGFVPNEVTGELVTPLSEASRGYSFVLRHDSKLIPGKVVKAKLAERVAELAAEGRKVTRADKTSIRQAIELDLCRTALVTTDLIHAFYDVRAGKLFVSGSPKRRGDLLTSELVKVFGALEAKTVYFDGVSNGLTSRLRSFIEDQVDAFDGFEVGGMVQLENEGEKVRFDVSDLSFNTDLLRDLLDSGYRVTKIALDYSANVDFMLDAKFRLSKLRFPPLEADLIDQPAEDDAAFTWRSEAYYRVAVLSAIVDKLTLMLGPVGADVAEEVI